MNLFAVWRSSEFVFLCFPAERPDAPQMHHVPHDPAAVRHGGLQEQRRLCGALLHSHLCDIIQAAASHHIQAAR